MNNQLTAPDALGAPHPSHAPLHALVHRGGARPAAALRASNSAPEIDRFTHLGDDRGLARYIPVTTLRQRPGLVMLPTVFRLMGVLPQYRFTARPVNRLAGGPTQPLSSAMYASWATDMVWHQGLGVLASLAIGVWYRRWPQFSSVNAILSSVGVFGLGLPAGLAKLSHFQETLHVNKLCLELTHGDPVLARQLGNLFRAMVSDSPFVNHYRTARMLHAFVEDNRSALPTGLARFADALLIREPAAWRVAQNLLEHARAYAQTGNGEHFAAAVRLLDDSVTPVSTARWAVVDETPLLVKDAVKTGVLMGLLVGEFAIMHARNELNASMLKISAGVPLTVWASVFVVLDVVGGWAMAARARANAARARFEQR